MDFSTFAREVYENAVAHGWHEEARPAYEVITLIHSEWSEALEEARAGRPLVWHACGMFKDHPVCDAGAEDGKNCPFYIRGAPCGVRDPKPEGIAVELIDGCLRILDWFGEAGYSPKIDYRFVSGQPLPMLVVELHNVTSCALYAGKPGIDGDYLEMAINQVFAWLDTHGVNPEEILLEKNVYNRSRDYRHGGKRF